MTGAGLHLEAEPFKWEWVGALSREQVFLVESLACLVLPVHSSFTTGLSRRTVAFSGARAREGVVWVPRSPTQQAHVQCPKPPIWVLLMPLQPLDSPWKGEGPDMMPELGTRDQNGKFSHMWDETKFSVISFSPFKPYSGWDSFLSGGSQLPRCVDWFLCSVDKSFSFIFSRVFISFFATKRKHWSIGPLLVVTSQC